MSGKLSVIIPTRNEQHTLGPLLQDLQAQQGIDLELLVTDGGSTDDTTQIARAASARLLCGASGRGRQMNRAAAAAEGDWLLFLHADSRLTRAGQLQQAVTALAAQHADTAGHFGLEFQDTRPEHRRLYAHMQRKSRSNRPQTINGDQGLLLSADFFRRLGGFDESLPILEDQAISERIFALGRWLLLPGKLITSARRFEQEGPWRRYLLMMLIMCARQAGVDDFFAQARALYPEQSLAEPLDLQPFYELLLELGEQTPGFWDAMADYARDNLWQLGFALDSLLGRDWLTPGCDRLAAALPPALFRRVAAPVLRTLFRGPVRLALARTS